MKNRTIIGSGTFMQCGKNPYIALSCAPVSSFSTRDVVANFTSFKGDRKKPLPHSYDITFARLLKGRVSWVNAINPGYFGSHDGNLMKYSNDVNAYFPLEGFPGNTYNNALSKCNEKLRGSIDLSVDIAQLGQTARMVKSVGKVETFTSSFRSLKALVAGVSAARLTYVYGIKPTVSTIYDCIDKVQKALDEDLLVIRERASSGVNVTRFVNLPDHMTTSYQHPAHVVELGSNAHKCEIKLRYRPLNNALGTWTSLNPVSLAWELLPYSFVVDWFFNVGNYVRNLETALLYRNQFVDGYVSQLSFASYVMRNRYSTYQVGTGTGLNNCTYLAESSAKRIRFNRSVLSTPPLPRMPSFQADLGSARLLNAAALLGVLLKK